MSLLTQRVLEPIHQAIQAAESHRVFIALSGGLDSMSLLHLLSGAAKRYPIHVIALHVDHGIHADSHTWAEHCEQACQELGIEFRTTRLELSDHSEATARTARYDWFRQQVAYGDLLLTAHHQQDRAETVLFNLLRGSGSAGLSSLRFERPFFGARLMRPLIDSSKPEILEYARRHRLQWIEDPSNQDTQYSRNYIRHNLVPALQDYRADAVRTIARAARNLEEENGLLREIAIADLAEVREQPRHAVDGSYALCTADTQHLSPARQANLLRFWLGSLQLHMPTKALMEQLLAAIDHPPASTAVLQEEGCQYRFYRGYLYVLPSYAELPAFQAMEWSNLDQPLALFGQTMRVGSTHKLREFYQSHSQGSLRLESREALQNPRALQGHSLNLKKWLQEVGVPPWRRQSLPILTLREAKRDVVIAPVDQDVPTDWVELQQAVA